MRLLLIDTETTGLEAATSHIWEIGCMIVDENWQYLTGIEVRMLNQQIQEELEARADQLPNLPPLAAIEATAVGADKAMQMVCDFIFSHKPQAVIAYNAKFDKEHLAMAVKRFAPNHPGGLILTDGPYYCAMEHVPQNYRHKCWRLGHIALDYGIAVDPSKLHGAYADIELTRKVLERSGNTPGEVIGFANEPWVVLRAMVRPKWEDGGKEMELAKRAGYSWQTPRGTTDVYEKCWVKRVKQSHVEDEIQMWKASFPIVLIKEKV